MSTHPPNAPAGAAQSAPSSAALRWSVVVIQALLALTFAGTGAWKLLTPIPELAKSMPWMGDVSPTFLYLTAAFDLLGGLGLGAALLPSVPRRLGAAAGVGCALLMVGAAVFHFQRGEGANTPFNFVMLGLSLFVTWGLGRARSV